MKTKLTLTVLLSFIFCLWSSYAQIPQGFNYQAIARDGSGNILQGTSLQVMLYIQSSPTGGTVFWKELHNPVTTNNFGLFSVVVGTGVRQTGSLAVTFDQIDWKVSPKYLKTEIYYSGSWKNMGDATQLYAVPYAMAAKDLTGAGKLSIKGTAAVSDTNAIFEVKNVSGQIVFAVYPEGVRIHVDDGKGSKGGFAVGGFDQTKGYYGQEYLRITKDSARIYVNNSPTKGQKGGFAVGGFDMTKGTIKQFLNVSVDTTGIINPSVNRVLWYPLKSAFLVGRVLVESPDSVGENSFVSGYESQASGDWSQALGYKTSARGNYSTAIGNNTNANGLNSFALGNDAKSTKADAFAIGTGARATGQRSFAFGSVGLDDSGNPTVTPTTASGDYSAAIGMGAQAQGRGSLALGVGSLSSGSYSSNLGYYSTASGSYSTALGYKSVAAGTGSGVLGYTARADGYGSIALGRNSYTTSTAQYSIALGDSAKAQGYYAAAIGEKAKAKANYSVAIGYNAVSTATGLAAGSFGYTALANAPYSVAVGPFATTASSANYSGAFGYYATTNSTYSVAVGFDARTYGTDAGAFGRSAWAYGPTSVAIGYGATTGASATNSSALGRLANASGLSSMALGTSASSVGSNSIAIGNSAVANANYSTSLGSNTVTNATALYSTALGYGSTTGAGAEYATAIGYNAQANGAKSISVGAYYNYTYFRFVYNPITHKFVLTPVTVTKTNIASDDYSIAFGNGNTANQGGLAIGSNNTAGRIGSVALGHTNVADSAYSFAAGANNYARGYNAFALGESVTAEAANSFVIGYNNVTSGSYNRTDWVSTDPLFVVGNGGSGSQSNALTVAKNGNTTINGNLYVTGSISSYAGTGDNLGNHILSQNLRTNGYYISNDGGNEGIWISTSGQIGIGNSSPAYTIDNSGSFRSAGSMIAGSNLYTYGSLFSYGNLYAGNINPDNNANLTVDAGTLHVDGTNNRIGINNSAPAYGLDVTGTMNVTGTGRFGSDVTLISSSPAFYFTDNTTGEDDFKFEANADALVISTQGKTPVNVLGMSSAGAVAMPSIGTGTGTNLVWNSTLGLVLRASSSMKYKHDIANLADYSWLYRLNPVSFQYNNDSEGQKQYGLIAEDVVNVNKELVFYKDGEPDAVNYNGLIAPLIKAVQDQKTTIDELTEENSELRNRIEKLEQAVSALGGDKHE